LRLGIRILIGFHNTIPGYCIPWYHNTRLGFTILYLVFPSTISISIHASLWNAG